MEKMKNEPGAKSPGSINKYMTESDAIGARESLREELNQKKSQIDFSSGITSSMESLDELLKRDEQREKDGFQKKIKIRQILAGPGKVVMVPYVVEEKLIHGEFEPTKDSEENTPGHGDGEVGDVISERPLWGQDEDDGDGDGDGDGEDDGHGAGEGGGEHGMEAEAYKLGKELAKKFQLPNLKDKGKKVPTDEYVYDLTDRHKGSGQLLDKKETLRSIVKTNAALGRLDKDHIDTAKLIVGPHDKVYRVLSKERVWKSQAVVFFLRDYSGSMWGEPTKAVVSQHLMIYAWLMDQYENLVIPRFIVHDERAKEVSLIHYFRDTAMGGTLIASGYKKINEIVSSEGLERDYNIYVFQGTDGDDGDYDGRMAVPEMEKILGYANRMGVCVIKHPYYRDDVTFERYVKAANFKNKKDLFRMHVMSSVGVTDEKNIEAVKALIAQD